MCATKTTLTKRKTVFLFEAKAYPPDREVSLTTTPRIVDFYFFD